MTIKHQGKNISAEKTSVITHVQDNNNGIISFILTNLYDDTHPEESPINIDLSNHQMKFRIATLEDLEGLKTSEDEQDIKDRERYLYLVIDENSGETTYQEYMWVNNDFEIIGSTKVDLNDYLEKDKIVNELTTLSFDENNPTALSAYQGYLLNQNKIDKTSIANNLSTNDENKVLSAKQGLEIQKIIDKLGLSKNSIDKFNFAVIKKTESSLTYEEFWILSNARYDYTNERFVKINNAYTSFGVQIQASGTYPGEEELGFLDNVGINIWRNAKKSDVYKDTSVYDYSDFDSKNYIGAKRLSDNKWVNFGISSGWNNTCMFDSYGGITVGGAGLEIDGNGIFPYSRVTHSSYKDSNNNIYYLSGILDNAYHPTQFGWEMDNNNNYAWFFGLKTPQKAYLTKDNAQSSFVIMYNDTSQNQNNIHELDVSKWHIVFELSATSLQGMLIDSTSGGTANSNKFITSGAVYSGLDNKIDKTDLDTVDVEVTFEDDSTEILTVYVQPKTTS